MISSRLDEALQQSLGRLMGITSATAAVSLATPLHAAQHNDWRLFKGDAYTTPPMPLALQQVIHEIVSLLDSRADMSLVRDPKTDEMIRDTLNDLLNKGPLMQTTTALNNSVGNGNSSGGGNSVAGADSAVMNSSNGGMPRAGSIHQSSSAASLLPGGGGGSSGLKLNNGGQKLSDRDSAVNGAVSDNTGGSSDNAGAASSSSSSSSASAVNPVEASIHLCDAIYDIQYSDAATRHTRLCRHLIHIMTQSPHEQHIRFAACVYRKILKSVSMAQKASQLKRKAHVGQGRLAQMNETNSSSNTNNNQQMNNNSLTSPLSATAQQFIAKEGQQHTAATGMELAKLNIINVWEDLAKDVKELCENALRQHNSGHHGRGAGMHTLLVPNAGGQQGGLPSSIGGQGSVGGSAANLMNANNAITNLNMNTSSNTMHQRSPAQSLGLLMIIQTTFPFLPANCSVFYQQHQFRPTLLSVVAVLAGSSESYVRMAASDCLSVLLTRHIKPMDVQNETNQLFEMLLRNLKQGNCPEHVAVGVCVTMKALLAIRGPPMCAAASARLSAATAGTSNNSSYLGNPPPLGLSSHPTTPHIGNASPSQPGATPSLAPVNTSLPATPPLSGSINNIHNSNNNATAAGLSSPVSVFGVIGGNAPLATKASFDHGLVLGFCSTALELHRNTRQPSVKSALSALFPFLARVDPQFENRKTSYVDAIIDPLKNIRDMEKKAQELFNFFVFLQTIGDYDSLKHETRVNFEAVLLRLLTSSAAPDQTGDTIPDTAAAAQQLMLPTACWCVIGAIFTSRTSTNLPALVERDCLMLINHTVLTSGVIEALKLIREGTAPFISKLEDAVHNRAKQVLLHTAQLIASVSNPAAAPLNNAAAASSPNNNNNNSANNSNGGSKGTSPPPAGVTSPVRKSPTSKGLFSNWFGGNSSSNGSGGGGAVQRTGSRRGGDSQQGQQQDQQQQTNSSPSFSDANAAASARQRHPLVALSRPSHLEEVMAAMDVFSKQQNFVSYYARNGGSADAPDVVAYNYWREMSTVMLPLVAHPSALIRAQCGRLLGYLFRMTIIRAYPVFAQSARGMGGNIATFAAANAANSTQGRSFASPSFTSAPHVAGVLGSPFSANSNPAASSNPLRLVMNGAPLTLYARAGMVPFLTAFSRRIVFEVDTRVKVALLHSISGGTSGMLIPGHGQFPTIHSELVPQDVIECFASLLNHVRRVREASLEVLLGVGGTTGIPSARAHEALRKTVTMHIKSVSHLRDPYQIACSCSTLTLLFEHRPTLLTTEILSSLMQASCGKIREMYGNALLAGNNGVGGGGGDNGAELQGLGVYDSQAKHRAMLSLQEGEEFVRHNGYSAATGNHPHHALVNHIAGGGAMISVAATGNLGSNGASALTSQNSMHFDPITSPLGGFGAFPDSVRGGGVGGGGKILSVMDVVKGSPTGGSGGNGVGSHVTVGVLNVIAMESAQTIVLLELINQLLIAGKMLQRQRLATFTTSAATESPNSRGTSKGFPNVAANASAGGRGSQQLPQIIPTNAAPPTSPPPPSPVLALTESSETRSVLQTLWSCLLHSSRTIAIVTSSTAAASSNNNGGASSHSNEHHSGSGHLQQLHAYPHHSHSAPPLPDRHLLSSAGAAAQRSARGDFGTSPPPNSGGGSGPNSIVGASGPTGGSGGQISTASAFSMDAQLVQIANAITIQHQALYALTDLLTLAPQNIIDFAHKTALVEYLRNEYLRCCGPQSHQSSYGLQHQRHGRDGQNGIGGGTNAASNALLSIASASKNERHRRTIIRLFALMGAIDPAKGGFSKGTTSDATSIVVEGAVATGTRSQRTPTGHGGGDGAVYGGIGVTGTYVAAVVDQRNNRGGGGGGGDANDLVVPKTSARSRDMILRNVQDLRRETYQFSGEANYPLTVYRMLAKLIAEPEGVSDQALDAALKVSLHLFTDPSNEKIHGWDLLEALMELVRPPSRVSPQIRLQALNLLPLMIRHRAHVAGQLVREFFSTVLACWEPSNEQTFLPLLAIIEELHIINLQASENFSSCISLESNASGLSTGQSNLPFALGITNEVVDETAGGSSLYLRLVDVAMRDASPTRDVSHKIIAIVRLIESQVLIAPVIVNAFVDYMLTNQDTMQLDLRVEMLKMLLTLTYRFGILNCITPIVGLVGQLLDDLYRLQNALPPQQPISIVALRDLSASIELILGKRSMQSNDHSANQDRFSTVGSSIHSRAIEVHRQCRKVLQRAAVLYAHANGIPFHENGLMTVAVSGSAYIPVTSNMASGHHYVPGSEKIVHVLDYVLSIIGASSSSSSSASPTTNRGDGGSSASGGVGGGLRHTSSNSRLDSQMMSNSVSPSSNGLGSADANPLDVIVLHINKASAGMKKGANFEWTQWFVSFQQHVLLHCPNVALRLCYDLFNLHEPLRKTLFYPAFHCLLVTVLRTTATSSFIANGGGSSASNSNNAALLDPQIQMQRSVAHAIRFPLRKVLTALLRFGDSESVDMCLGLHDYLEHFRNPNADDNSTNNALGSMFTAATPHRFEDDDEDGMRTRGGCTLPTLQSQRQLSGAIRRTAPAHSHTAAASLPAVPSAVLDDTAGQPSSQPLLTEARSAGTSNKMAATPPLKPPPVSPTRAADDEEFARVIMEEERKKNGGQRKSNSRTNTPPKSTGNKNAQRNLPWSLFRAEDLIRAALEHRLHYKAVRYLENDFHNAIKAGSRNPRTQPGRGISNGPLKSMAAIPAIRGLPQVDPKAAIGRASRLPATSANAVGVVNALALQYSRVNMQSAVEGLYNSVHIGVDATGYELLQWWPEANNVYKRRIQQYERDSREWAAMKSAKSGAGANQHHKASPSEAQQKTPETYNASFTEDAPGSVGNFCNTVLEPTVGATYADNHNTPELTAVSPFGRVDSQGNSRRDSPFQGHLVHEPPRSLSPFSPLTPTKGDYALSGSAALTPTASALVGINSSGVFSASQTFPKQSSPTGPPVLRTKDVEGYLRTLCFCGAWDEGLAFAREKFSLLKDACESSAMGDTAISHRAGISRRSATAVASKDETKKANMSRISIADSAVMCASLCAIIMNQWDDVKRFSDLMIDTTNRLLFTQIFLARNEIATFGGSPSSPNASTPLSTFHHPNSGVMTELEHIQASAQAPALLLEIENNLAKALVSVDKELKQVMPMSYTHAYEIIAKLQHFQEIEEARLYRRRDSSHALQSNIKHMWFQRFQCMRPDAVGMLTSIVIYSLAAQPHDIPEAVYHFSKAVRQTHPQLGTWAMSSLQADALQPNTRVDRPDGYARKNSSFAQAASGDGLAHRASSLPSTPVTNAIALVNPQQRGDVQVDYCEYLWSTGGAAQREKAIDGLKTFLNSPDAVDTTTLSDPSHLINQTGLQHLGRAHLLLGQWKQEISPDRFWKRENREEILHHLSESIHMVPQEYNTWHNWALMNYRVQQRDTYLRPEERRQYMERAHRGFVAAICRGDRPKVVIQDIMRLLQLWIIYGGVEVLGEAVVDGIHRISASLWASCTPQVVAHLGNEHPPIWAVVRSVLEKTLYSFPQLCVFQLLVPILSDPTGVGSRLRPSRARMLLNISCPEALTAEARSVSEGLVELAMFPLEFIRDRIGQGLKIFRSVEPPIAAIEAEAIRIPCQQALVMSQEKADSLAQVGPVSQVIAELLRLLAGGTDRDFLDARSYCERLYNELQDHVKELKSISLSQCTSPKLALATLRNLSIWVPGEYTPQRKTAPTIYGFVDRVEVLESKRRPRRMHIVGSDGNISTYCLKGNEDVRVDARAMQLFWLVNSFSSELQPISRFPVIPLTEDCGLLGWVHESETLYNTIRTFRTRAGIRNDPEMDVINKEFTSPQNINKLAQLTVVQRADLFEHLFNSVESKDMAHVLWYRSVNAELWLKRRTRFTTSLAVMSTAGYILGLGDRHPGNLLLQMATGAVVHIDFGDCFDVARYRSSFPETVPFRLTPMLVNAMEIFGVSGAFQATCEASMASMRTNRDSIVALLSAFVYDPVMDKRISQYHGGNVQGVLDQVRRKLRGMEMPAYYYKQNAQSTSWKQPVMSEATGRNLNNKRATNANQQLSPSRREPSSSLVIANAPNSNQPKQLYSPQHQQATDNGLFPLPGPDSCVNSPAGNDGANNGLPQANLMHAVQSSTTALNPSASGTAAAAATAGMGLAALASQLNPAHHLPQHTIEPDAEEVLNAVMGAVGGGALDAEAALALDLALDNDNNENESTNAPTKREAAVRGEEHVTWALQPRPDLPFVLSQAHSERAMKIAGVPRESLTVKDQVRILINESTKPENLSALFAGWTAWW